MEKKEKLRWYISLLILSAIVIFGINIYADFNEMTITIAEQSDIVGKVVTFAGGILIVVLQLKSDKNSDIFKTSIKNIEEFHKHIKEINQLCNNIENELLGKLDESYNIDSDFEEYITSVNDSIIDIIKKQYERGFDSIRLSTFKNKIQRKINKISRTANIDSVTMELITKEMAVKLDIYIKKMSLIINLENGIRRGKFISGTLKFTNDMNSVCIELYKNKAA